MQVHTCKQRSIQREEVYEHDSRWLQETSASSPPLASKREHTGARIRESRGPSLVNERVHKHNPKLEQGASNECRRSRTLQKEPMNLESEEGRRREGIHGPLEARMERRSRCNSHGVLLLSTRLRNVDVSK